MIHGCKLVQSDQSFRVCFNFRPFTSFDGREKECAWTSFCNADSRLRSEDTNHGEGIAILLPSGSVFYESVSEGINKLTRERQRNAWKQFLTNGTPKYLDGVRRNNPVTIFYARLKAGDVNPPDIDWFLNHPSKTIPNLGPPLLLREQIWQDTDGNKNLRLVYYIGNGYFFDGLMGDLIPVPPVE